MPIEHKTIALEIKSIDDGGSFEGLGAVFHNVDSTGDIIAPGAFKVGLPTFLADGFVGGLNHDWNQPIGKFTAAYETRDGLFVQAKLSDVPEGNRVRTLMRDGVVKKLSIGYETLESKMLTPEDTKAYWQSNSYTPSEGDARRAGRPVRLLTAIKLHEVSPVTMPANDRAAVLGVKGETDTDESTTEDAASVPSFDVFSHEVVSANRELLAKVQNFALQRQKSGRVLSATNRQRISAAIESMKPCLADLEELLASTDPTPPKSAADALELRRKRLHFLASLALAD